MTYQSIPWLEIAVLLPLTGAVLFGRIRDPLTAWRCCLFAAGATLVCGVASWVAWEAAPDGGGAATRSLGATVFSLDALSAPLVALIALLHFLTVLSTTRTGMNRFPVFWLLAGESLVLALFGCTNPWVIGGLLAVGTLPPYFELRSRGRPTPVYVSHMGLFVALLLGGLAAPTGALSSVLVVGAVLVRSGTFPVHAWLTDVVENCSFGTAILHVTPIAAMYAAVRLVLPTAPEWVLDGIGAASLVTAVYAAGLAAVQSDSRRFFAYLFLSLRSLVIVGLELHTAISLTGALALWVSVSLSATGLGLTLRSLEARFGRVPLTDYRGLYAQSPALAVCFLLTGLAAVGFPATLGFVATELLVDGAVGVNPAVGFVALFATALNGVAVMRVYFLLFTGTRHTSGVSLNITLRERFALLTLAGIIIGGGLAPQLYIDSCYRAAGAILYDRGNASAF